jgi:NADH-quinone oxidoreductase subunit F
MNNGNSHWRIAVGLGSCGIAAGAQALFEQLQRRVDPQRVRLEATGCAGLCHREPMLEVYSPGGERFTYVQLDAAGVDQIVEQHLGRNEPVEKYLLHSAERASGVDRFLSKQKKIVLEHCGHIDPESLEARLAVGGYQAVRNTLGKLTPAEVIATVTASGLRGRGGAGFPTGVKWKFAAEAPGAQKYLICNGDEGDPGAFMDRGVMESDPHRLIEGMIIGGYAIGASVGFLYVRAEYPLALKRLGRALEQARAAGFLGRKVLGTDFDFDISIREGAGAFVCGEETALIQSIEGERGSPKVRPPFPAQKGLWGCPTVINNVETFANIPWILRHGAAAFASLGTEKSKGTKVFSLAGKVRHGGLVEVPMGITLREILEDIGGGSSTANPIKAVQTGGPSGGCIPANLFGTRIDYEELAQLGAIMGSGGMIVLDDTACMVDFARYFLSFTSKESCGKCAPCRLGTQRLLEILTRITEGQGTEADLETLEAFAASVKATSLCGLGQTAPNPILTALRYYRHEFVAHVRDKKCPAKSCRALLTYSIDAEACRGCTLCAKACPVQTISGGPKKPHVLDYTRCIRCGACLDACKFGAVHVE